MKQRIRGTGGSGATVTADLLAQQKLSASSMSSNQEVAQLLLNPNVLAIGLVLFIVGIVVGKLVF